MTLYIFILIIGFKLTSAHESWFFEEFNFYGEEFQNDINFPSNNSENAASREYKSKTWMNSDQQTSHNFMSLEIPENPNHCYENDSIQCDRNYPYRKFNGTCNNLNHPTWGAANECYLRFLPSYYSGTEDSRQSISGGPLVTPRDVTRKVFQSAHEPSSKVSFMFAVFGLTVGHDVAWSIPIDSTLNCCAPENRKKPYCWNIFLKPDDPFYSQFNWTCLGFRRTYACQCNTTKREQTNGVTAAFDGSIIYGNSEEQANQLRANDGTGKLAVFTSEQGDLLPTATYNIGRFCPLMKESPCFMAGDIRVNLHSTLAGLQTIYMREHNRLATQLKKLNRHWDEERLYQEARKINIAQLQCIAYKEFLPILLGPVLMEKFHLYVSPGTGGTRYNQQIRFGTRSEFATATFRLHSMVAKNVGALDQRFKNLYLNTELIRAGHLHQLLHGISKTPSEEFDGWFVKDISNHLFQVQGKEMGTDLVAMDILRGRDHGLPPYVNVVKFCSGGEVNISTFADLSPQLMEGQNQKRLKLIYRNVEDIDLFAGLQMERHFPGSQIGPTSACLISRQFYFLKFGDRFYFEHEGEVPSFTAAQREALKSCSLSSMLCANSQILQIQKNAMLLPSVHDPEVPCSELKYIDLNPWKEESKEIEHLEYAQI